jgi:hypothetical protein
MKSQNLRAAMPTIAEHAAVIPAHKLSAALLEFAAPLLAVLGDEAPLPLRQESMQLAITAWNAGAMAMPLWGQPELLRQFEQTLTRPTVVSATTDLLQQLLVRRQTDFGRDPRAVGDWQLSRAPDGSDELRCTAHLPSQGRAATK